MSELQLSLLGAGAVVIALVLVYNAVQERRARRRAERAFGQPPPDVLFDPGAERREPTLGAMPGAAAGADEPELAGGAGAGARSADAALHAPGGPEAEISPRIDTVAVILADDPVMAEQVAALEEALARHGKPVHVEGIVDEQWEPVGGSARRSWRELRVGLQLANRSGPLAEDEIEGFNAAIADFAADVNAVSQRESPAAAAQRARDLDRFCAETDIEVAVNVVGQFGATFAVARVRQLALEAGLAETASGELVRYGADGAPRFSIRRFGDAPGKSSATYYAGLTFALDVPQVPDAPRAFDEMVALAVRLAGTLGGQLVDDNRRALSDQGIGSIRRSLEQVYRDMEAHGIPAGGALARRLYA